MLFYIFFHVLYASFFMNILQPDWKVFQEFPSLKAYSFKIYRYIKKTLSVPRCIDVMLKYICYKRWCIFSSELARNPQLIILITVTHISKIYTQYLPLCHLGEKKQTIHFMQDSKIQICLSKHMKTWLFFWDAKETCPRVDERASRTGQEELWN